MGKRNKKFNWKAFWFNFVLITLILSTAYALICLIRAPYSLAEEMPYQKVKADYIILLLLCAAGILCMFLPSIIERKIKMELPSFMHIAYVTFLYAAIYLGEVRNFYYDVPHWDTLLHTCSGVMLGALGFFIVDLFNRNQKIKMQLSPGFVAVFAFTFAVCLGTLWEICEFSMDSIFRGNMQKYMLQNGTPLIGQAALMDTMKDLIVDTLGALIMCIIGYFDRRRGKVAAHPSSPQTSWEAPQKEAVLEGEKKT